MQHQDETNTKQLWQQDLFVLGKRGEKVNFNRFVDIISQFGHAASYKKCNGTINEQKMVQKGRISFKLKLIVSEYCIFQSFWCSLWFWPPMFGVLNDAD